MDYHPESEEIIDTVTLFRAEEEAKDRKKLVKKLAVLSAFLSAGYFFLPSPVIAAVQGIVTAIKAYLTDGNP